MEEDGLISHGPQLTWMDAATIDSFITPRAGKAVEIQALWYNALKTMELLARLFNQKDDSERYSSLAKKAKKSFDKALKENKSAITILLASTLTEGVKKAIKGDRLVRKEFNLADILTWKNERDEFLQYLFWILHLER